MPKKAKKSSKKSSISGANRRAVGKIRPTGDTQDAFLAAIREFPNVKAACASVGINRDTHYEWMKDAGYAARFEEARKEGAEVLHQEMWRRGVHGVPNLKFHEGQAIIDPRTNEPYVELEFSDSLLSKLMTAHDPAFREKIDHKHTGKLLNAVRIIRVDGPDPYPPKGKK